MSDPSLPQYPDFPAAPPAYPAAGPDYAGAGGPALAPKPSSIRRAVQFMYAGAVLSAVLFVIGLVNLGSIRHYIRQHFPKYTLAQVNTAVDAFTVTTVVVGIVGVGIWIWLARANDRGRRWARVVGTVLFALDTLSLLGNLTNRALPAANVIAAVLPWLCGLGAVVMMWNRASSEYYNSQQ
jgi:hypothetical protein